MVTIDYATVLDLIQQPGRPDLSIDHWDERWVLVLEAGLTIAGFAPGRCTDRGFEVVGRFSDDMKRSVEAFQTSIGVGANGCVGPTEWAELERIYVAYMRQVGDPVHDAMDADVMAHFGGEPYYLDDDEREALAFLHDYEEYRYGRLQPVGRQLHAFQLADHDPAFQMLFEQALADREGTELGLYLGEDGTAYVRTAAEHERVQRRQRFLKGAKVHTDGFLGGIAYAAAKALGATEDQALAAGQLGNTVWSVAGAHADGTKPVVHPEPATSGAGAHGAP